MTRSSIERLADYTPIDPYEAANAAIVLSARRCAFATIKTRARAYLAQPAQLDFLGWHTGFFGQGSLMTPDQLIAFAREVLRLERAVPRYELVPVKLINAKAAIIAGHYKRHGAEGLARWKANSAWRKAA